MKLLNICERDVGCTIDEKKVEMEELCYGARPMYVLHRQWRNKDKSEGCFRFYLCFQ